MRKLSSLLLGALATQTLVSCSDLYTRVHDPAAAVPSLQVTRSLRCEMVTFLTANYQRAFVYQGLARRGFVNEANLSSGYLDIDRWQYAVITVDLKDVLSGGLNAGLDWKYPSRTKPTSDYKDFHLGPNVSLNGTYNTVQQFAIPQYAALGPAALVDDETKKLYLSIADANGVEDAFFCYRPIVPAKATREDRLSDLQGLVSGGIKDVERFDRILVDGQVPLAAWLQAQAQGLSTLQRSSIANSENIFPGQLSYSFAIEAKLSLDMKYTLVASARNPFVPDFSLGTDNTSTFTIYLNAAKAGAAFAGKAGGAKIATEQQRQVPQTPGVVSETE